MSVLADQPFVTDSLRRALGTVPGVEVAFLFGSFARGEAKSESDIDLIAIGSVSLRELVRHLHALQSQLDREINPHVYTPLEFRHRLMRNDHFLSSVLAGPVAFIVGNEHE